MTGAGVPIARRLLCPPPAFIPTSLSARTVHLTLERCTAASPNRPFMHRNCPSSTLGTNSPSHFFQPEPLSRFQGERLPRNVLTDFHVTKRPMSRELTDESLGRGAHPYQQSHSEPEYPTIAPPTAEKRFTDCMQWIAIDRYEIRLTQLQRAKARRMTSCGQSKRRP